MGTTILLADDHRMVREGLRILVDRQEDMSVIAEADNGREAVRLCYELSPDLVLMDVSMPELNGIEATRRIVRQSPNTKVVALSMQTDRRFVVDMLTAGASGYLLKDNAFEDLVLAIKTIINGHTYLSPAVVTMVVEDYVSHIRKEQSSSATELTSREREVLQLLAEGCTTKAIAEKLDVSAKTVETHRVNIKKKLGLEGMAQLTKYAIRERYTSL